MDRYIIFVYGTADVCIMHGNPVYLMPNGVANGTNISVAFKRAAPLTRIPRTHQRRIMSLIAEFSRAVCIISSAIHRNTRQVRDAVSTFVRSAVYPGSKLIFNALSTAGFANVV